MIKSPVLHIASPSADEQISLRSTIDLLALIWRRKLPLALGVGMGIVLGGLYYLQAVPMYQSTAEVLVIKKRPAVVTRELRYESHFEDYVSTHQALIVSPLIVERAIESSNLGSLETFVDIDLADLVEVVIDQLEVGSGPRNLGENADSIMNLAFSGPEADECPIVVQSVLDSYKAFLSETYRGMSDDTETLIGQARDILKNDLQQLEEGYALFRQQSPLVTRGADEVNPLQDRLAAIETHRSQWIIRRFEVERQLKAIEQAMEDGSDGESLLAVVSDLRQQTSAESSLPSISTGLDNQLFALMDRERKLVEHFGEGHPHIVSLRQQIAATRQVYTLPTAVHMQDSATVHPPNEDATTNPAAAYVQYLQQELKRIQISEELLAPLYSREHDAAAELSSFQLRDERFRRNIERTQQLYDGVISQLQQASLIGNYGGFEAQVIGPPRTGEKVSPSARITLLGSLVFGTLCGLFMGLVAELSDQSFHSRDEIQNQLGARVLGQIPHIEAGQSVTGTDQIALDPMLCAYFQPRSLPTEALRALRATLFFGNQSDRQRVIQLTSPGPGEGTSLLSANLAISMAQSGKQVLLIDADLYTPQQHEIFGVGSARTGLASVVASDDELTDAICPTMVDNLWLLPAGPLPPNAPELFMSPRLSELIDAVREKYDYVLIDTGPLLVVSDPCVVAPQVDGILLNLHVTKDSRRRAKRAIEILDPLDAKLLGVVVNGIGEASSRGYRDEIQRYQNGYYQDDDATRPRAIVINTT